MLIDVHGHIGRIVLDRREFMDAANLIARMDAWKIDVTCVLPVCGALGGAVHGSLHRRRAGGVRVYPRRLIPFCLIDPRFAGTNPRGTFRFLLDEYRARGCKGIGEMLPKLDFDDPRG